MRPVPAPPSQIFPLAVATATVLGLMVSMYTVWAGALYTVVWVIMLGLANTLIDQIRFGVPAPTTQGFPVIVPAGKYGPGFPSSRPIRVLAR